MLKIEDPSSIELCVSSTIPTNSILEDPRLPNPLKRPGDRLSSFTKAEYYVIIIVCDWWRQGIGNKCLVSWRGKVDLSSLSSSFFSLLVHIFLKASLKLKGCIIIIAVRIFSSTSTNLFLAFMRRKPCAARQMTHRPASRVALFHS